MFFITRTNQNKNKKTLFLLLVIRIEELPNKVKGIVRNSKRVEAEIAALKISYLKRINKGSNIIIMDSWVYFVFPCFFTRLLWNLSGSCDLYWFRRYSDSAKIVAKTLKVLGYKNCWIVTDGFSGGRGWLQSRLGTDSYNFSFAQVLSPSRIIPAASRFGTRSGTKFLPSSDWKQRKTRECVSLAKVLFLYSFLYLNFERSFDKIFELLFCLLHWWSEVELAN